MTKEEFKENVLDTIWYYGSPDAVDEIRKAVNEVFASRWSNDIRYLNDKVRGLVWEFCDGPDLANCMKDIMGLVYKLEV